MEEKRRLTSRFSGRPSAAGDRRGVGQTMHEFGERHPAASYTIRRSAYAIIAKADGRMVVVRTPKGVFLPGGGCTAEETEEEAVIREVMEECGLRVQVGPITCRAIEFLYAEREATFFEIPSAFFEATMVSTAHSSVEQDHVLEWWDPITARGSMVRESHAWAICKAAAQQPMQTDGR